MNWSSWSDFFAMGGYAGYVWPAYVISILVLGVVIVLSLVHHSRARKNVRSLEAENEDLGGNQK